jgi:hypothetical protein
MSGKFLIEELLVARILLLTAIVLATSFPASAQIRVDGITIPVPPNLRQAWEEVQSRDVWHTGRGDRIEGHFQRFVVRRFHLFRKPDGELHIRVSWFRGGKCHTSSTPVRSLSARKRAFLRTLFGRFDSITAPVSQVVTFCEFDGSIVPGHRPPPPGHAGPSVPDDPTDDPDDPTDDPDDPTDDPDDPTDDPDDLTDDPDDPTDDPDDPNDDPVSNGSLIPLIRLAIPAKNLLGPFAEIARQSFSHRFSSTDCRPDGHEERDTPTDDEDPEDGDGDDGHQRPHRYGFLVRRFVSPAGSIQFELDREHEVCITAANLGQAARKLHERFRPHVRPVTRERVSYRFRPKPSACRPSEGREKPKEDDKLSPTPDPLETGAQERPADTVDIPV